MHSTTTQYVASRRMGLYEPMHPIGMWGDFKGNGCANASASMILQVETNLDNQVMFYLSSANFMFATDCFPHISDFYI